jgi:hypothetical protein
VRFVTGIVVAGPAFAKGLMASARGGAATTTPTTRKATMPLRPGVRAWAVWAVALSAYVVGVLHRTWLVLGVVMVNAVGWALVIAWPGRAPLGILRTRRPARRRLAQQGIMVRPIREILAERRGFTPARTGKAEELDRQPQSVGRGGHD